MQLAEIAYLFNLLFLINDLMTHNIQARNLSNAVTSKIWHCQRLQEFVKFGKNIIWHHDHQHKKVRARMGYPELSYLSHFFCIFFISGRWVLIPFWCCCIPCNVFHRLGRISTILQTRLVSHSLRSCANRYLKVIHSPDEVQGKAQSGTHRWTCYSEGKFPGRQTQKHAAKIPVLWCGAFSWMSSGF